MLIVKKNLTFKLYCCFNRNMFLFEKLKALQYQLHVFIEEKYYTKLSNRLANPLTSSNT